MTWFKQEMISNIGSVRENKRIGVIIMSHSKWKTPEHPTHRQQNRLTISQGFATKRIKLDLPVGNLLLEFVTSTSLVYFSWKIRKNHCWILTSKMVVRLLPWVSEHIQTRFRDCWIYTSRFAARRWVISWPFLEPIGLLTIDKCVLVLQTIRARINCLTRLFFRARLWYEWLSVWRGGVFTTNFG